jgi:hypothetical protein
MIIWMITNRRVVLTDVESVIGATHHPDGDTVVEKRTDVMRIIGIRDAKLDHAVALLLTASLTGGIEGIHPSHDIDVAVPDHIPDILVRLLLRRRILRRHASDRDYRFPRMTEATRSSVDLGHQHVQLILTFPIERQTYDGG